MSNVRAKYYGSVKNWTYELKKSIKEHGHTALLLFLLNSLKGKKNMHNFLAAQFHGKFSSLNEKK